MITNNTVFILGAGSSIPYSYPSGYQLMEQIISDFIIDQRSKSVKILKLNELGFNDDLICKFRNDLYKSNKKSVDSFLEWRKEYLEIGKACIALELIPCESENLLFNKKNKENWYEYIYDKMNTSFESFTENRIAFITFNYDRSLEHFLFTSLKHTYGKTDTECANKISSINIIHLHGVLGFLSWQSDPNRSYNPSITDIIKIKESYSKIKIIHENIDIEKDTDFLRAHKIMTEAEHIYFLGFGYNDINLSRLKIRNLLGKQYKPFGSSMGLTDNERANIELKNNRIIKLDDKGNNSLLFVRNIILR